MFKEIKSMIWQQNYFNFDQSKSINLRSFNTE